MSLKSAIGDFETYYKQYCQIAGANPQTREQLKAYFRKIGWTWTETPKEEENEFGKVSP